MRTNGQAFERDLVPRNKLLLLSWLADYIFCFFLVTDAAAQWDEAEAWTLTSG
jgi:hypothetical protein